MNSIRLPDWTERHIEFIAVRQYVPFAWGTNDCGIFFADHTLEITGKDPAERWRGYRTQRELVAMVRQAGGLRELAEMSGLVKKHEGLAQRGDGVLANVDGRKTFGVVTGDGNWCGPGECGLLFRPMSEALVVYEI